ncbi:hypothetical protein NliqN6_0141 [Naganishia liquefaciens]|uniref:Uncharacterized protein n=1 Tax=Naganishia liquefaciens TaxID=104408 RepID=A0A8H3YBX7_9TREE|nr:hypothetical protein NliqN6_0141 [Naganishia liquefaciens]
MENDNDSTGECLECDMPETPSVLRWLWTIHGVSDPSALSLNSNNSIPSGPQSEIGVEDNETLSMGSWSHGGGHEPSVTPGSESDDEATHSMDDT